MKTLHIKSEERGQADHGWLKARFMFSFANYYNPEQMSFGTLRVLNDDIIQGGTGFPEHPHANMEIVTVPLSGSLKHVDNMGNSGVISSGEVQVMSAGTGVFHSEFNGSTSEEANICQIWVMPGKNGVEPRYDQLQFSMDKNVLQQIVSPDPNDAGSWIHADAWFNHGVFDKGQTVDYQLHKDTNGLFLFLIEGIVKVGDHEINRRDGFGVWDTDQVTFEIEEEARLLLLEVPMLG
ncbi:MAG: pirin family protein [Crocinitomicaceae bacterium]